MKKLLFAVLLFAALLFLTAFPVLAEDRQPKIVVMPANEIINRDYLSTGDSVRISGTVNGDAYAAGGTVDVDGTINGDLLVVGGNILITGIVKNDVRVAGGNITFSGATIGGNVTTLGGQIIVDKSSTISGSIVGGGGNLSLLGPIGKGLTIGGGQVTLGNDVGGDITAGVGTLTLLNDLAVNGKLVYWSENKATISDTATVSGGIKQEIPIRPTWAVKKPAALSSALFGFLFFIKVADLLMLLAIGLFVIWLLPVYVEKASAYVEMHFWMSMLIGFLAVAVTPIVILLLLISAIGIPLAGFLFVIYLAFLWFGRIFALLTLGKLVTMKTGKTAGAGWAYTVGVLLYFVLGIIPVVSFIADTVVVLSGVGTLLQSKKRYYSLLRSKKMI